MAGEEKINISNLDNWKPGDKGTAEHLDQPVKVLQQMGGITPPNQDFVSGGSFETRMFKVVRLEQDVIICVPTDDVTDGEDETPIAMPYLMRKTPWDSEGANPPPLRKDRLKYTFTFTDADTELPRFDKRTSIDTEDDDDEQIQVITGAYEVGDLIYAMTGLTGGTGVFTEDDDENQVIWLDLNIDARYWASSDEVEEEEEE